MRALVLNVKKANGFSKKDGSPYEMFTLTVALPIRDFNSPNYKMTGYGYDVAELSLDPQAYSKFSELKEPRLLELQTESGILFGELKEIVVGFTNPVAKPVS